MGKTSAESQLKLNCSAQLLFKTLSSVLTGEHNNIIVLELTIHERAAVPKQTLKIIRGYHL
jgi:hypothetical protein